MTEPVPAPDEEASEKKAKRLTEAEWARISEEYELGLKNAVDLATEYGISRQALSERFKKHGIRKGSRAHELSQTVNQTATQAVATQTQAQVERFADKRLQRLEETNDQGYKSLEISKKIADKTLMDAMKNGLAPAAIEDDIRTLRRYNQLIVENMNARRHILGADTTIDEAILPQIIVDDITAEKLLEHHKGIGAAEEDATIDDLADIIGHVDFPI